MYIVQQYEDKIQQIKSIKEDINESYDEIEYEKIQDIPSAFKICLNEFDIDKLEKELIIIEKAIKPIKKELRKKFAGSYLKHKYFNWGKRHINFIGLCFKNWYRNFSKGKKIPEIKTNFIQDYIINDNGELIKDNKKTKSEIIFTGIKNKIKIKNYSIPEILFKGAHPEIKNTEKYKNNLKKKKIYRDKNKIKIKNYNQQYYKQNKNKILEDAKKKVKCKYCQKLIQKNYYQKHIENYCKSVTT